MPHGGEAAEEGRPDDQGALVEAARALDAGAWETLYRRAYPGLLAYASRRLDADRAREAVAETMARAVAGIERFAWKGGGFDGWLYGILRHVVADAHRSTARDAAVPARADARAQPGPLDQVLQGEEVEAVRRAFEALEPRDREVLELRVVAGLDSDEAAAALGKRPGAVRMAQARALRRLRRRLERGR